MRLHPGWYAAAAALLCLPAALPAQINGGLDTTPPTVSISPATSTQSADSVRVTVTWSDNAVLDSASRSITVGNTEVSRTLFGYTGSATAAVSVGTVHLGSGANVVRARIADQETNMAATVQVTYTYSPPPPPPPSPPSTPTYTYSVQVTPKEADTLRAGSGSYVTPAFVVTNTGTGAASFVMTASCPAVTSIPPCRPTRDTVSLAPQQSTEVGLLFGVATPAGGTGQVWMTAKLASDPAVAYSAARPFRAVAPGTLGSSAQLRPYLERGECVTLSLGGGAAAECGDLRLAHALPGTRTLNRSRAPVLLYSSQHAYPHTVLNAFVTNSTGAQWDSVGAVVRRGGVLLASGRWPGWADATARQVALGFAEPGPAGVSAAVLTDSVVVSAKAGGAWTQQAVVPVTHVVVDRRTSAFGSGWWMAGLEGLFYPGDSNILWVGGDGSARLYQPVSAGRWASAGPSGPDTIRIDTVTLANGVTDNGYVRVLPGKGRVAFDVQGRHIYTQNRLGQATRFLYDASNRLSQVVMPTAVPGDASYAYQFVYNSAAGTLGEVLAPYLATAGDRRTLVTATGGAGAARVTALTDFPGTADSSTVRFAYDALGRDTAVTAPGTLTRTSFTYSSGGRLQQARTIAVSNGRADTVLVATGWQATRGIASPTGTSVAPSTGLYTGVDGPLPGTGDYVHYYQDAGGRVTQVTTPQGSTTFKRLDPRFPALVTQTVGPNQHRVTAAYDTRGRLSSQTDWNPLGDGRYATTLYAWDDQWDEVASIISPTGITTTYGYDARGLREWQQVGPDSARRTRYGFNPQGQVTTVRSVSAAMRGEAAEVLGYDAATGNLATLTSPLGIQTLTYADRIGRDTLSVAPVDTLRTSNGNNGLLYTFSHTVYDRAGRVRETTSSGQAQGYYLKIDNSWRLTLESVLHTRSSYDAAGRLWQAERWSFPDSAHVDTLTTRFEFDGFGRKTAEIAPDNQRDAYYYDRAGRDTLTVNRRGEPIRTRYDVMGHVLSRVMAGDSSSFTYDAVTGAMLSADNAHARIRRSYYPNGALKGDTSQVAFENGSFVAGRHVYGLRHDYDLEGRQIALTLSDSVRPSAAQSQFRYGYDAATGELAQITDPLGNPYTFRYRTDGALDTLGLPGNIAETHRYDADGRLTRRMRAGLYDDSLRYDLRGKTVAAIALSGTAEMTYDGLGHLAHSFSTEWHGTMQPESEEEYAYDGLGNKVWHRRTSFGTQVISNSVVHPTIEHYAAGTARDTATTLGVPGVYEAGTAPPLETVRRTFDLAGNLAMADEVTPVKLLYGAVTSGISAERRTAYVGVSVTSAWSGEQQSRTSYTYRPDGKLTLVQRAATCIYAATGVSGACTSQQPAYTQQTRTEGYRYDALGRRVWVKTVTLADTAGTSGGCAFRCDNTTRRTVWDGDDVLAEIRYPNTQPEQDTGLDSANVAAMAQRDAIGTTPSGHPYGGRNTSDWAQHGRVLYVHGGGMDQPMGLIRLEYSYDFPAPTLVVPHASWRGVYETATFLASVCTSVYLPSYEVVKQDSTGHRMTSPVVDANGNEYDETQLRCVEIDFPGKYQGMTRLLRRQTASGPISWMGSLMQDGQDASGLMFRRNRFYDPASGRFTQEDPIGLAGGVNSYGFAEGDPVNYSDPSGLCPPCAVALAAAAETAPEWGPPLIAALSVTSVIGGHKVLSDYSRDHPELFSNPPAIAHAGPAQADGVSWVHKTEPTLPPRLIAQHGDVSIEHNYRGGDHGYAHAHVNGGGPTTRIGQNGKPYRSDPTPTPQQQRAIDANRSVIRRAIGKIGQWLDFHEGG